MSIYFIYYYPHFTKEEPDVESWEMTCPKPCSCKAAKLGSEALQLGLGPRSLRARGPEPRRPVGAGGGSAEVRPSQQVLTVFCLSDTLILG